ncbi:DNA alkylation repair protein [Flammeovirga kamogawensis]|uniref:DNA alkylation repair protein n=1 Tax=Flammeovirga kamogawensis TaxID=373891 RepID=A0ABX8GZ59_9BACT|nr:DNA alkylation repair protein [Flammeovirga kamogawensis]MBB6459270.1 3-methyladenine DNA glycosylase AlkD [Flammeovirga kamogawensis]QWG08831.1 DNA alkylation repair protein [Flammeovirga kamogawensis]TRX67121.1 DNA alkylation repair protein [Flammeovirga kamogawensis]
MKNNSESLIYQELSSYSNERKREKSYLFFQAFEGGYGEGDVFLGVSVPDIRKVAKANYLSILYHELVILLKNDIHEMRMCALFMMIHHFEKKNSPISQENIISLYLTHLNYINNWDLVDCSAYKLLGRYIYEGKADASILYDLSKSSHLWTERVSVVATYYFIKRDSFDITFRLCEHFLEHKHDLMHKATGWMLKEIGKRDQTAEEMFLKAHYKHMARTTLRYAIEKFDAPLRLSYLNSKI